MPRLRRRRKARTRAWSREMDAELLYGRPILDAVHPEDRVRGSYFDSPITKRAAWIEHCERLLAEWIQDVRHAGTRPWAWWKYDARKPRRLVRGYPESELAYLTRLGLMSAEERALVEARAQELAAKHPPPAPAHPAVSAHKSSAPALRVIPDA